MPLVIVTGRPATGKTTVAEHLVHFLRTQKKYCDVELVNEESLQIQKASGYADASREKMTRGALMSAVERALSTERIVIADSLNYIKGYRYQLYCLARQTATSHCVVSLLMRTLGSLHEFGFMYDKQLMVEDTFSRAKEKNMKRSEEQRYEPSLMEDLWSRFETPEERNRWDSPLFTISLAPVKSGGLEGFSSGPDRDIHGHLMYGSEASHNKSASVGEASQQQEKKKRSAFKPAGRLQRNTAPSVETPTTDTSWNGLTEKVATVNVENGNAEYENDACSTLPSHGLSQSSEETSNKSERDHTTSALGQDSTAADHSSLESNGLDSHIPEDVLDKIFYGLIHGKKHTPSTATQKTNISGTSDFHLKEKTLTDILSALAVSSASAIEGDMISVPHSQKPVFLKRKITQREGVRLKRQFLKAIESKKISDDENVVGKMFVEFLNSAL